MKKICIMLAMVLAITMTMTSCHFASPDADEEAVLTRKPILLGHGGVKSKPVETGRTWVWFTTKATYFKIVPTRYDVVFDDIMSNDNTPLDYATYITLQVNKGESPMLLKNYGKDWFANRVEAKYRNFVRDEVSKYSPFDLMSNREVSAKIDEAVKNKMEEYFEELNAEAEFPVRCCEVITGRAKPSQEQMDEMNATAAAIQAKKTQEAREEAEKQRAIADKAYMKEMGMDMDQYITLKIIEKANPNIDILMGSGNPMWNVRR